MLKNDYVILCEGQMGTLQFPSGKGEKIERGKMSAEGIEISYLHSCFLYNPATIVVSWKASIQDYNRTNKRYVSKRYMEGPPTPYSIRTI